MYLGYHQYQIRFDLIGLGLLALAVILGCAIAVQLIRGTAKRVSSLLFALALVIIVQFYRGWMAPDQAWLPMLGAIEKAEGTEKTSRLVDFSDHWDVFAGNMRAVDWLLLSHKWNVCHAVWHQDDCANPKPSEDAFGVTREILNEIVIKFRTSAGEA